MAAITVSADRLPTDASESRRDLLVSLSRIMAITYCGIGAANAVLWLAHPSLQDAVSIVSLAILVGISLASVGVARSNRLDLAAYLQIGGLIVVVTIASTLAGRSMGSAVDPATAAAAGITATVNYAVAVVLAGLLLRRRDVLWLTGIVLVLYLLHSVASWRLTDAFIGAADTGIAHASIAVLGLIVLLSVLASEYASRMRATLAQLDSRAKEVGQHAMELKKVKAEIELRVAELEAAREELESQRGVSVGVAVEIRGMAQELTSTSKEQAGGSSEQAAAMGEIVATMEELSRAASQIASNGAQVSLLSVSALQAAEAGREAVEETIAGLDRIRGEVRTVAEKNLTLGQKTQAIGEIIEVISEIADRTHLLALNAAIESAAAGEYGRRFSVVASQVKELASESKSAAHQVRAAVGEIQRAASSTVLAAEKSETDVKVGAGLGRGAGDAISTIVETVHEAAAAAREMLLATQQQQSASEQVVSTVRQIEKVTRQSAEGSRQISQTVGRLMNAAERLQ